MHELYDIQDISVNGEIYTVVGMFVTHFVQINYKNFFNVFLTYNSLTYQR